MKAPNLDDVYEYFRKFSYPNLTDGISLWVPTKTRNEIIADNDFSSSPKFTTGGRVYRWRFSSIGGGMWEISLGPLTR